MRILQVAFILLFKLQVLAVCKRLPVRSLTLWRTVVLSVSEFNKTCFIFELELRYHIL